jgi:hypothetical protein
MSDKEYLESVKQFYEDRLKSQLKEKFRKCEGCKDDKQFIEEKGKLIYSCSKNGKAKDKCGLKMTINLAQYLYYPDMKRDVNNIMDGSMDLSLFDDIYTKEEIKTHNELIKENAKLFKKCKKPFSEENKLKARVNLIKKTHKNRIDMKIEQNILMNKLTKEDDDEKKQTIMKEYLQLNLQIKDDYLQVVKSNKPLYNFLLVEEGNAINHN